MAPYEALYGRKCRTPLHLDEVGERAGLEPDVLEQTAEAIRKIRERMKAAQSRRKSYADNRRIDLSFEIGDHVFLRIAPMKGVMHFGKKGKLSPRYIEPYEILERIGTLAYHLALPPQLSAVHSVFHVSALRKYIPNPSHVLSHEPIQLAPDLSYEERPERILLREVRKLRNRSIPMVKIQWSNQSEREATWETEADMLNLYL
ncbi:hypothetical protein F511_31496 [Dorcoceras hygrometricum]|uniref:Chromo domain-containing protein n=1 Tax=Dorcoceras hygrometricum TaxID=472368 RepID=A0A2Z7A462_9LAMI|nr:hypothetical protein F511_31496 [Dorcoceras hygrometricum]